KKVWAEKDAVVTSPQISFSDYPTADIAMDDVINIMLGDLQRIPLYYEKGFQTYQPVPEDVWQAYEALVEAGYDNNLIEEPKSSL
ncbi:MAG: YdcF family protein, partial [Chloroflexota bacterium]